jgi:hypothetical protein
VIYVKSILAGIVAVAASAIIVAAIAVGFLWNVSTGVSFGVSTTEIAIVVAIVLLIFTSGFFWEFRRLKVADIKRRQHLRWRLFLC